MVTLLCFCCEHRNPAGARFCNACGTPLNLKPCKRCEAINERAAAHCRQCGETFPLEFVMLDDAPPLAAPADGIDTGAVAEPPVGIPATRVRRYLLAVLVAVGVVAAAWFGVRVSPEDRQAIASTQPVTVAVEPVAPEASAQAADPEPLHAEVAPVESTPDDVQPVEVTAGSPPPDASEAQESMASDEPQQAAPAPKPTTGVAASRAVPPRNASRPAAEASPPSRVAAGSGRTPERNLPSAEPADEIAEPPSRPPLLMAVDRPSIAIPRRPVAVERPSAPRPRPAPRTEAKPAPRLEVAPPCIEGYVLASDCDVRFMPKGN